MYVVEKSHCCKVWHLHCRGIYYSSMASYLVAINLFQDFVFCNTRNFRDFEVEMEVIIFKIHDFKIHLLCFYDCL